MTDIDVFISVLEKFREQYPNRKIEYANTRYGIIVSIDGEEKFNITGYNLLYNLYRLTKCLEGELI